MSDSEMQSAAVQNAVRDQLRADGRVFDLSKKVASQLHYGNNGDDMERFLEGVRNRLQPRYIYAYKAGDGKTEFAADNTVSKVITDVDTKTTPAAADVANVPPPTPGGGA